MDTQQTLNELERLPVELAQALDELVAAEMLYGTLKREGQENAEQGLAEIEAEVMLEHKFVGSNQKLRDAELIQVYANHEAVQAKRQALRTTKARVATAENDMKLAQAKAKALGYQLRAVMASAALIAEILRATGPANGSTSDNLLIDHAEVPF